MGAETGIEWTDSTWSPNKGCDRISPGCLNCYAEVLAGRFCGPGLPMEGFATLTTAGARWTRRVELVADRLDVPVRWRSPRRIFVNSQSDTFHERLPDEDVLAVFGAMAAAPQHTFQVLTKRAERMEAWFRWADRELCQGRNRVPALIEHAAVYAKKSGYEDVADRLFRAANDRAGVDVWPLPNVWLGVSVENQECAEDRIPHLLQAPTVVRFLSCEPLLGPLDLRRWVDPFHDLTPSLEKTPRVSWVIVGGESGRDARPMHPEWVRAIRDQCKDADVPLFFKQWGEWRPKLGRVGGAPGEADFLIARDRKPRPHRWGTLDNIGMFAPSTTPWNGIELEDSSTGECVMVEVGKKAAGAFLDGVEHKAFPVTS